MDTRTDLPKVHYATALDWFILITFGYCMASIIQFASVHYFTKVIFFRLCLILPLCRLIRGSIRLNSINRFITFLTDIFLLDWQIVKVYWLRAERTAMWTVGNVTKKSYCKLSVLKPIFRFPIDFIIPLTGKLQRRTFLITGHWMAHFSSVVGSNSPRHVMSYWSASYLNLPVNNDPNKKERKEVWPFCH